MKQIYAFVLILFLNQVCHAGHNGLTHAAITNCPNYDLTESVSWDKTKFHWLRVSGQHIDRPTGNFDHWAYNKDWTDKDGGWEFTWRAHASCNDHKNKSDYARFDVSTHHHIKTETGKGIIAHTGYYMDCKAYDGWWDI